MPTIWRVLPFVLGLLLLAVNVLVTQIPILGLEPVPVDSGLRIEIAWVSGLLILVSSILLCVAKTRLVGAAILAFFFFALVFGYQFPQWYATPSDGTIITVCFEDLAIAASALVLIGLLGIEVSGRTLAAPSIRTGQIVYGVCLLVYAWLHYEFHDYVAAVIPQWIPAHQFFAYATGVAHAAAGLAFLTGVCGELSSLLVTVMFGLWFLILHIPRVLANTSSNNERTSMLIALTLCGGAWIVNAGFRAQRQWRFSQPIDSAPR